MKGKCFSGCNRGQRNKSDNYYTPYSITEQLFEVEKFDGVVLEPACGYGSIGIILQKYNLFVIQSDIKFGIDFLKVKNIKYANIITNPPFSLANEFIIKAKELYTKKIAMLLPLSYLHGQKRYEMKIFSELAKVYVFTRYPMLTNTIREDGKYKTGMMVYAWYIWEKGYQGKPEINWIDNSLYVLKKEDN